MATPNPVKQHFNIDVENYFKATKEASVTGPREKYAPLHSCTFDLAPSSFTILPQPNFLSADSNVYHEIRELEESIISNKRRDALHEDLSRLNETLVEISGHLSAIAKTKQPENAATSFPAPATAVAQPAQTRVPLSIPPSSSVPAPLSKPKLRYINPKIVQICDSSDEDQTYKPPAAVTGGGSSTATSGSRQGPKSKKRQRGEDELVGGSE
ncbi:hypothetical protein MMC10_007566 [Thelotrema lepadinum]|nr:hypothetical protein [Thelotrema lepadinum]